MITRIVKMKQITYYITIGRLITLRITNKSGII